MVEYIVKRTKVPPAHPGELMREIIEDHVKLSVTEAAKRMQVSRQSLHAALGGERVTADMALRFGKLVGGDPALYVNMQAKCDLWRAESRLADTLKGIKKAPIAA